MELTAEHVDQVVRTALAEDVGSGDLTTQAVVPADARCRALLLLEEPGVACGVPLAAATFAALDPTVPVDPRVEEGAPGTPAPAGAAHAEGPAPPGPTRLPTPPIPL